MNTKLQIAVLMEWPSEERDVSLRSGKAVMAALQRQGHAVHAVDPCEGKLSLPHPSGCGVPRPSWHLWRRWASAVRITPTGSGLHREWAGCQSPCLRQGQCQEGVHGTGLPTPAFSVISDADQLIPEELSLPLVVKPSCQGSSVGLHFVEKEAQWQPAIEQVLSMGGTALVEQCVFKEGN